MSPSKSAKPTDEIDPADPADPATQADPQADPEADLAPESVDPTEHAGRLDRYKTIRTASRHLHSRLVSHIESRDLLAAAKRLGLEKDGRFVFQNDTDEVVLIEHAMYQRRLDGSYLYETEHAEIKDDEDEQAIWAAMSEARYTLLRVDELEAGVGLHVTDMLDQQSLFIYDIQMSQTVPIHSVIAGRVIEVDGLSLFTGAALPVTTALGQRVLGGLRRQARGGFKSFAAVPPGMRLKLEAFTIKTCLADGATYRVAYGEGPLASPIPRVNRTT